jgi:hypothetical protein
MPAFRSVTSKEKFEMLLDVIINNDEKGQKSFQMKTGIW